jgi:hypothetical protein
MASYKLGAMITAKILHGSFESWFKTGRPKAAVLPVPVYELMITLFP